MTISGTTGLSMTPFHPAAEFDGWSGVGYALVFTTLSFAGFEGAATLGEEALSPRRNIPIAMAGTVLLAGAFFVFVSYAQVMGYGLDQMKALSNADAPLNTLSIRFISRDFAVAVDLAAAVSAFSATLGALSAAARMLFALGREGLGPRIGDVDPASGTPKFAVLLCGGLSLLGIALWGPLRGGGQLLRLSRHHRDAGPDPRLYGGDGGGAGGRPQGPAPALGRCWGRSAPWC